MAPPAAPTAAPTTAPTAASFTTSMVLSPCPLLRGAYVHAPQPYCPPRPTAMTASPCNPPIRCGRAPPVPDSGQARKLILMKRLGTRADRHVGPICHGADEYVILTTAAAAAKGPTSVKIDT